MKTTDKTVYRGMGFCSHGTGSNICSIDIKDGKIARIRPAHYDEHYTPDDLNYWKLEAKGHTFEPGMKSLPSPLHLVYKKRTYSNNRISYPLKRVDWDPNGERNPQNRGISGYERISWDEATETIAKEIVRIHKDYTPYAILAQGEGHGETKAVQGTHGCQTRMLEHIGGFTNMARQPDSWEGWYWGAKHVWGMDPVGQNTHQNNLMQDIARHSDALLFWGADIETTPWGWGGQQASRLCYWLSDCGVKQIYICPDVNYACGVHADKWIPIYPNTDAALQLAIAYVWMTEGTVETEYLATHSVGYDWFEHYVLGNEDGIPKTPEWAAELCGIPSYRIKALARYWASHVVSIAHCNGGGMVRSVFCHEPARLEVYLLAMRGVGQHGVAQVKFIEWSLFGNPGYNPLPGFSLYPNVFAGYNAGFNADISPSFLPKTLVHKAILGDYTEDDPLTWYGHTYCSMPREDQLIQYRFPLKGHGDIHMLWTDSPCWETCWNGGNEYQDALRSEKMEFVVVQHPWMENECYFADIVLPISTKLEREDFGVDNQNGQWSMIYHEAPGIDRVGESLSDYEAVGEVARKLEAYGGIYEGLYDLYTSGKTVQEHIEAGFKGCGIERVENDVDGAYELFMDTGLRMFPTKQDWENDTVGLLDFYEDPQAHPLETPSGLIEFYSTTLASIFPGDTQRGPVAHWVGESDEHHERMYSDRAEQFPFLLVSNHPHWRVHAQHDDVPWLREIHTCKVVGPDGYAYEPIWVHPSDAERLGLSQGDVAKLYNERGAVLGGVYVTERIMPGVLYQDHGARVDCIVGGIGGLDRGGANNLICPSATSSQNAAGEVTNGFLVGIEKVDVFQLAQEYPEEFSRDYDAATGVTASARIER